MVAREAEPKTDSDMSQWESRVWLNQEMLVTRMTKPLHLVPEANFMFSVIHKITGEKSSRRPSECRGGILADEMGMGKSLTLLALIVRSLGEAYAFSKSEPGPEGRSGGQLYSRGTLIVAPKSSTLFLHIVHVILSTIYV